MMKMEKPPEAMANSCNASPIRDETYRVSANNLFKYYGSEKEKVYALRDVSLQIEEGEMVVLLGPSGCGKTTLLRSIAGLESPQQGEIRINGNTVTSAVAKRYVPPEDRNVSMVFQSYALWPHMTVRQNMEYPLRSRKVVDAECRRRVEEIADIVGLSGYLERYPAQMSGGQQQRVALGRAIVAGSDVVLFDEPLSNVDAKVREQIRREIASLQRRFGFSGLYVTHDQTEASAIADRLVVMDHGIIVQSGAPEFVYHNPVNKYVATFMGSANCLAGQFVTEAGATAHSASVLTDLGIVHGVRRDASSPSGPCDVLFRPEACKFEISEPVDVPNRWPALLRKRMPLGPLIENIVEVQMNGKHIEVIVTAPVSVASEGTSGWLSIPPAQAWIFGQ